MKIRFLDQSLIKFLIVGAGGLVLNLFIFYLLADVLKWDPNFSAIIDFVICVTVNYFLNHIWSFKEVVNYPPSLKSYFKFFLIYLIGLSVNLLVLNIILILFMPSLKVIAQFFGSVCGTFFDFFGAKFLVFVKNKETRSEELG